MSDETKKGITVKIDASLHAQVREYLDAHNMTMEEFYSQAVNADYIVYNGTIVGALTSVDDLLGKDPLFAEFKAVKEGNVWTVDKTWYQDTANVANLIIDMNIMLTDGDQSQLTYMKKIRNR